MLHIKTRAKKAAARRATKKKSATRKTARETKPSDRSVATDYQQRSTGPLSLMELLKGPPIPHNELIEEFDILRLESTPKALAPTPDSIGLPNAHGLSSSLPHGSIEPDPKKCNRPPSVEIDSTRTDSTRIDSTRIDRPASELVAQEELGTHAVGEAPCDTGMAATTMVKQDEVCTPDVPIGIYEDQECTPHVHIKADKDQGCTPHVHIKADEDQECTPWTCAHQGR